MKKSRLAIVMLLAVFAIMAVPAMASAQELVSASADVEAGPEGDQYLIETEVTVQAADVEVVSDESSTVIFCEPTTAGQVTCALIGDLTVDAHEDATVRAD